MPKIKVEFLPFRESIRVLSREERERLGLIMDNGKINEYRRNFIEGKGASIREKTWNRRKQKHECCGSHVSWRHLKTCPKLCRNTPEDLSDLKDLH